MDVLLHMPPSEAFKAAQAFVAAPTYIPPEMPEALEGDDDPALDALNVNKPLGVEP
jgi:hypothetical protein